MEKKMLGICCFEFEIFTCDITMQEEMENAWKQGK